MKKLLLILFLFLAFTVEAQITTTKIIRVATDSTIFGSGIVNGVLIGNNSTGKLYDALIPIAPTKSIKTSVIGVDIQPQMRDIDTINMSNRIDEKLNISDTAAMLLPYITNTEADNKYVDVVGDTMTGALVVESAITATGVITGSNLSGTNTGDQDITGITTNATNIQTNIDSLAAQRTDINSNTATNIVQGDTLVTHNTRILANKSSSATNITNISTNTANISTNTGNINTNTGNITTNTNTNTIQGDTLTAHNTRILANKSSSATNATDISTNTGNITTNTNTNTIQGDTLVAHNTRILANKSSSSANTSNISTNTTNITTNLNKNTVQDDTLTVHRTDINTNTTNIATNVTSISGKQPQLNGTGFVKAVGTTISYDASTYYLASNPSGFISSYTETDPVFVASPAYGIIGTDITNWNTAYGWGDWNAGAMASGYVPYFNGTNLVNSGIYFDGTNYGLGTIIPGAKLEVAGNISVNKSTDGATVVNVINQNIGTSVYAGIALNGLGNNFSIKNWGDSTSYANLTEFTSTAVGANFAFTGGNLFLGYTVDPTSGNKFAVNGNGYFAGSLTATGTILGSNLSGTNTGDQDISGIATNATNISTNSGNISTNAGNISTNTTNITTNLNKNTVQDDTLTVHRTDINTNTSNITKAYIDGLGINAATLGTFPAYYNNIDTSYIPVVIKSTTGAFAGVRLGRYVDFMDTMPDGAPTKDFDTRILSSNGELYFSKNSLAVNYLMYNASNLDSLETALGNYGGFLTTEADPIFVASPAYGILSTDITNWNTAYGWGDWHHTTLSGYGITDGAPISGSANYIQNQDIAAQTADLWISGTIKGSSFTSLVSGVTYLVNGGDAVNGGYLQMMTPAGTLANYFRTDGGNSYFNVGNLFIGYTADPTLGNKLAVNGNGYFAGSLTATGNLSAATITPTNLTAGYVPYYNGTSIINTDLYFDGTNYGLGTILPTAKLDVKSTWSGGTGDYTDVINAPLKINGDATYWRVPYVSGNLTISGIYNYETGKNVYWGEATDTGKYIFRGRDLIVEDGNLFIGYTADPTLGNKLAVNGNGYFAGSLTATGQIISTLATGTAPFSVISTTLVSNLNADLWDGNQFATYLNQSLLTTSSPTFNSLTVTDTVHAPYLNNINTNDLVTLNNLPDSLQKAYSFIDYYTSNDSTYTFIDTLSVNTTTTTIMMLSPTTLARSDSYNMSFGSSSGAWNFNIPGTYEINFNADVVFLSGSMLIIRGYKEGSAIFRRTVESHDSFNPTNISIHDFIQITQTDIDNQNNLAEILFTLQLQSYSGTFDVYFYNVNMSVTRL